MARAAPKRPDEDEGAQPVVSKRPRSPKLRDGAARENPAEKLDALGAAIGKYRTEAVDGRKSSGIEQVWTEDIEFCEGIDDANRGAVISGKSLRQYQPVTNQSIAFPNITAAYVDAAAARVGDILVPTDERAWSIKETPVPELLQKAKGGLPIEVIEGMAQANVPEEVAVKVAKAEQDAANATIAAAKEKAERAQKRIEDWHVEGQFHAELRKVIDDAARIGTGILKGPVPVKKRSQMYRDGQLLIEEVTKPVSKRVDPRNVFPDPACGQNPHDGRFIFERAFLNRKQVAELKGQEGYNAEQINLCLREGPSKRDEPRQTAEGKTLDDKELFEVWYFHGEVTPEDMEVAGFKHQTGKEGEWEGKDAVPACLTLINDRVVKAALNHMDTGEFPYDFFPWERRENSPWGKGIARKAREGQRIVVAATRVMLTNAGRAAGPVFVLKNNVKGANGKNDVEPWKVYYAAAEDASGNAQHAIAMHIIPSLQKELMEIIRYGMDIAERETGMPMMLQGQVGAGPDTYGGQQLADRNATGVLRRIARQFDDTLTEPHIRRYYTYLLLYGEDDFEKGEFVVDAKGSTALVERALNREQDAKYLQASLNPQFGLDPKKAMDATLRTDNRNPKDYQYTEEELQAQAAQQQQKPADPRAEASKEVAQVRSKTEIDKANIVAKSDMTELQFKAAEAEKQRQHESRMAVMTRDLKIMELAENRNVSVAQIKAELAGKVMTLRTQEKLATNARPSPQVAKPAVEPPGRAPDGQAFPK